MDDQTIFSALTDSTKSSESSAIETIYSQVAKPIRNFILKNSGSAEEAEDMLQDAIILFLNKVRLKELDALTCKISTYIFSIARNNWLYELRKKNKMPKSGLDSFPLTGNLDKEPAIYPQLLGKLMESIKEPCKSIIESFYMAEMSIKEMAMLFGYKDENSMKKKKSLCMKLARQMAVELLDNEYVG